MCIAQVRLWTMQQIIPIAYTFSFLQFWSFFCWWCLRKVKFDESRNCGIKWTLVHDSSWWWSREGKFSSLGLIVLKIVKRAFWAPTLPTTLASFYPSPAVELSHLVYYVNLYPSPSRTNWQLQLLCHRPVSVFFCWGSFFWHIPSTSRSAREWPKRKS